MKPTENEVSIEQIRRFVETIEYIIRTQHQIMKKMKLPDDIDDLRFVAEKMTSISQRLHMILE